jgi:predicted dienelactone hydrolase
MNKPKTLFAAAIFAATTLTVFLTQSDALASQSKNISPIVGTHSISIKDTVRNRNLTTEIWFQAGANAKADNFSPILPIASISIASNSEPSDDFRKRPLIVISHGNWGTRYSQGWLASRLVKAGYVVLSPSHPGTMNDGRSSAGAIRLWDRSDDIRYALSAVLQDPRWSKLIAEEKIGFWGHSFGGWTGLSLAGGVFDMNLQTLACTKQTIKDMYCNGFLSEDVGKISLDGSSKTYLDNRFKAFYLTATGPVSGMTTSSLSIITTPLIFDTAQFDEVLAPSINSSWAATIVPGAKEIPRPVGHFAYVPMCKPIIGKLLASLICTDPKGVDRAEIHEKVGFDVIRFFDQQLGVGR